MKLLGLTGGVGMGKSKAADLLVRWGMPLVDTDDLARQIVLPRSSALAEIEREFGSDVILDNGELNRSKLARLVFADQDKRQVLELILHPRIRRLWKEQVDVWRSEGRPVGIVVIPLLFEIDSAQDFDAIICVACSANLQRQRLGNRGWMDGEINQRISSQWPVEKKMNLATFVVWNESPVPILEAQLKRILQSFGLDFARERNSISMSGDATI